MRLKKEYTRELFEEVLRKVYWSDVREEVLFFSPIEGTEPSYTHYHNLICYGIEEFLLRKHEEMFYDVCPSEFKVESEISESITERARDIYEFQMLQDRYTKNEALNKYIRTTELDEQYSDENNRSVTKDFVSANILNCTVTHNGYKGGDAGHGAFVNITLEDLASTSMFVNGLETDRIDIEFRGDCERWTLINALKFALDELENNLTESPQYKFGINQ